MTLSSIRLAANAPYELPLVCAETSEHQLIFSLLSHGLELTASLNSDIEKQKETAIKSYELWLQNVVHLASCQFDQLGIFFQHNDWNKIYSNFIQLNTDATYHSIEILSERRRQILQKTIAQIVEVVFHALEAHNVLLTVLEGSDRVKQEIFLAQAQAAFDQFYQIKEEIDMRQEIELYNSRTLIRQTSVDALSLISTKASFSGFIRGVFSRIQRFFSFRK